MYCRNCGTALNDNARFCAHCGMNTNVQAPYYTQVNQVPQIQQQSAQIYGQTYGQTGQAYGQEYPYVQYTGGVVQAQPTPKLSMAWYKFIIYFQLFVNMISNFCLGFMLHIGGGYFVAWYGDKIIHGRDIYPLWEGLRILDILYAFGCLGLAILGFVTRQHLKALKKSGPILYLLLIVGNLFWDMAYFGAAYSITNTGDFENLGMSVGISVGFFCVNYAYFKNRKHLFVN